MDKFLELLQSFRKRLDKLERLISLTKISVPTDGWLVVDSQTADPPVDNGRIYYNTTTNKFRVCENGAWRNMG